MRQEVFRTDFHGAVQDPQSLVVSPREIKNHPQGGADYRGKRIHAMSLLGDGNGLVRFAPRHQIFAVPVVDNGLGGFKFDGPLEVFFQFFPVPVVQADMRERSVSLSKPVIQLQGLSGGQFGPLKSFLGGDHAAASQHHVGIRDSGVGRGVVGMKLDFFIVVNALAHAVFCPLVPGVTPTQVGFIGPCGNGRGVGQTPLFSGTQFDLNLTGDGPRDFALELQDVPQAALIVFRPSMGLLGHQDQLS